MTARTALFLLLFTLPLYVLTGCESDAARQRREQREIQRKVAQEEEDLRDQQASQHADTAAMLREQNRLDGVEQKRTNNPLAHSCRKITFVSANPVFASAPPTIDTSQCTPEQLRAEQEAETRQKNDELFKTTQQ